mmetsp:Transcript_7049/g.18101  ORF Transcript_7049/g.18101 Transcript_7049/m.18101 type:complete len:272 (-) Transcript_7049:6272-7087(-)
MLRCATRDVHVPRCRDYKRGPAVQVCAAGGDTRSPSISCSDMTRIFALCCSNTRAHSVWLFAHAVQRGVIPWTSRVSRLPLCRKHQRSIGVCPPHTSQMMPHASQPQWRDTTFVSRFRRSVQGEECSYDLLAPLCRRDVQGRASPCIHLTQNLLLEAVAQHGLVAFGSGCVVGEIGVRTGDHLSLSFLERLHGATHVRVDPFLHSHRPIGCYPMQDGGVMRRMHQRFGLVEDRLCQRCGRMRLQGVQNPRGARGRSVLPGGGSKRGRSHVR